MRSHIYERFRVWIMGSSWDWIGALAAGLPRHLPNLTVIGWLHTLISGLRDFVRSHDDKISWSEPRCFATCRYQCVLVSTGSLANNLSRLVLVKARQHAAHRASTNISQPMGYINPGVIAMTDMQGPVSISDKTSYRKREISGPRDW